MFQTGAPANRIQRVIALGPLLLASVVLMAVPRTQAETFEWETKLRASLDRMARELTEGLRPWPVPDRIYRITDYGAQPDGERLNTEPIQRAIEACSAAGGGVVLVEGGHYVTGTIDLKSGVMLEVAEGASLVGSLDLADYPDRIPLRPTIMDSNMALKHSLIYAERCERIGIRGKGEINGRGTHEHFPGKVGNHALPGRPFLIRIIECKQVHLSAITLRTAAAWMQNYLACEDVIIDGITVENLDNWNTDAIDIDGCHHVIVRNCTMNSQDDGLCFKTASMRDLENVFVENCTFYSTCNAIKFGTDSQGDFRRVLIRNVVIGGPPPEVPARHRRRGISGISLQTVDGGTLEDIMIQNVRMDHTESPFCLRLGDRGRVRPEMERPVPGELRNIIIENIQGAHHGIRGSIISGIPGSRVADVIFRNVDLRVSGGGVQNDTIDQLPEMADAYPDAFSFGKTVPAYGFWIRHADRIRLINVSVKTEQPDARPWLRADYEVSDITLY